MSLSSDTESEPEIVHGVAAVDFLTFVQDRPGQDFEKNTAQAVRESIKTLKSLDIAAVAHVRQVLEVLALHS
jgi:hypothetical protein